MRNLWKLTVVFLLLLMFPIVGYAKNKNEYAATPNLSFPIIATDII